MPKEKPVPPAAGNSTTQPAAKQPERFISAGFTLRSREYPAGAALDHLAEHDLRELIVGGHAVPALTTEPAPVATTPQE